jgi:hypothetical protein
VLVLCGGGGRITESWETSESSGATLLLFFS